MEEIQKQLFAQRDEQYAAFQAKLMPTVPMESVIGVRTPQLRAMAKQLKDTETARQFMDELPHVYFDENQLHAFLICTEKDFMRCMAEIERFLPYVDNWATCDQMHPVCLKKHGAELLPYIRRWLDSDAVYTVRFGIGMLMTLYLDEAFDPVYLQWAAEVRSDEYYVNMMIAWYFATALTKQYDAALPYIKEKRLSDWTHNKSIRKAIESGRIPPERKEYLRSLQVKTKERCR